MPVPTSSLGVRSGAIEIAARNGLGALAFSFLDPDDARKWAEAYYDIIKSDACVPLGHRVNANIAMVSAFSLLLLINRLQAWTGIRTSR